MSKSTPLFALSLLASSLYTINSAYADTHLTYTDTNNDAPAKVNTIQIKANKVRSQDEKSTNYTLFDGQQNILYTVDTEKKQYTQVALDEVKKMAQEAEQLQAQMHEKITKDMVNLPEDQRKVVAQRLANFEAQQKTPAPVVTVQKTMQTINVNHIPCMVYQVSIANKPSRESCINNQAIPANDLKTLQAMFGFMNQMSQYTAKIRGEKIPDFASLPSYSLGLA
ncbi:MAG TPA: hypothetical protein ENK78_03545, partial [Thiothrix sp.]|nr:hypothetical protein [Thiothrix sp.]